MENIRLYLGEMDEKERANQFINLQIIEEEAVRDDGRAAVQEWLERLDTDDGTKWQLLSVFLYRERYLDEIIPLLNRAQALIDKTKAMWQPLVRAFECFWNEKLKTTDVMGDIKTLVGVDIAEALEEGCLFICPNIISF